MRVATSTAFETSLATLQRRQQAMADAQQQLTSGKRVAKPSDDPAAAARAERAMATLARSNAQQRALDASKTAMQLGETALGDAGELLQQVRETVVAAGNGSYTDAARQTLAQKLAGLRQDLLAVANRSDGAGRFVFGGQGSDKAPFLDTPAGVSFNGSAGDLQAASGEASPLSTDGRAAWLQAPDPANPGSTVSLFDVIDKTIAELQTPNRNSTQIAQSVTTALGGIDAATTNISGWRARAGAALNRIDGISSRLAQTKLDAQQQRSDAEDLDMVQAISDFQSQQTGYDAALKTYSLVQKMSLFDYLK